MNIITFKTYLFILILIFQLLQYSFSQIYTLRSVQPPVKCIGGKPCVFQPAVAVLDAQSAIDITFEGLAYVQIEVSPTGFEQLYLGECDTLSCGTTVVGTIANAKFINGIATFSVC